MLNRSTLAAFAAAAFAVAADAQISTSNEDGATGAYSSEVESSFVSDGRRGPRTAIDDLRADVDRDREQIERVRLKQLQWNEVPVDRLEPFLAELALQRAADIEAEREAPEPESETE